MSYTVRHALYWLLSLTQATGAILLCAVSVVAQSRQAGATKHTDEIPQPLVNILRYISASWDDLTRSTSDCAAFSDTKTNGEPALYLPQDLSIPSALNEVEKQCKVQVERLPNRINRPGDVDLNTISTEGLLYLPNLYVVPGGQFNEMYGWDSYFIIRGLLREHRLALAKGMVENFFFEIEHYGGVLNANRTYYLTRSQPPFLSSMVLAVYDAEKAAGQSDLTWLARGYSFVARDYEQWNQTPHLAGQTGLSRYFDHGDGPVPEIKGDPSDYYRGVAQFFLIHGGSNDKYLVPVQTQHSDIQIIGPSFSAFVCDSRVALPGANCSAPDHVALSAEFYKGDRSMRESGFDVTFRFGPFGADTHHYLPVCLNSLLFKMEKDLAEMSTLLGRPEDAVQWQNRALNRQGRINEFLWNERRDFTSISIL